ncbi:hypothetical protein [Acanthopleuribacter pedis]|uniref:Uncharacterized protein n=1 Tax=Acanthopleuribacter pedis TaxID=442870 RepID=A0A8J7Q1V6_9BACT|nr:hypothetical protein [Acanthopleuribacter pedis]MBO1317730.1 hypothetical protein [Acanthopleuribacter pedis]
MSGIDGSGGGIQRSVSKDSVHSAGSGKDQGKISPKPGDRKASDPERGGGDMKEAAAATSGKRVSVKTDGLDLESLRELAGKGVPRGSVSESGFTRANEGGTLVRFAPAGVASTQGDGYFTGGYKLDTDAAAVKMTKMAAKMKMAPDFELTSLDQWNDRLGTSIGLGVSSSVNAPGQQSTMGEVIEAMPEVSVRLIDSGAKHGRQEDYGYAGKRTFNKLGRRDLKEMPVTHESRSLPQMARDLGPEFAALPDTPENRGLLIAALTNALTEEVSARMNG